MALARLKVPLDIDIIGSDPLDPNDVLRKDNPLGKMPVLVFDDGRRVFDSRVILEYVDHLAGGGVIIPSDWPARADTLTFQAMSDGISDAALLIVYEGRHRPEHLHHQPWIDFQKGKVRRGLAELTRRAPDPKQFNVGSIGVSCMLGYLDWRKQVDWRQEFPALILWLDEFRRHAPEYDTTLAE
jgi:glutathione S-transferase